MMASELSLPIRSGIIILAILLWLVVFFWVNRLRVEPQRRRDLATPLDHKIPFTPRWALVYFSTYILVMQPFIILSEARLFFGILASYAVVTAIATLVHVALPSQVRRVEDLPGNSLSERSLGVFQRICKPYDNFPSTHVAFSVLAVAANYIQAGPVAGSLILVWAILVALSTMFTKQHTLLDVLSGVLTGAVAYLLVFALL